MKYLHVLFAAFVAAAITGSGGCGNGNQTSACPSGAALCLMQAEASEDMATIVGAASIETSHALAFNVVIGGVETISEALINVTEIAVEGPTGTWKIDVVDYARYVDADAEPFVSTVVTAASGFDFTTLADGQQYTFSVSKPANANIAPVVATLEAASASALHIVAPFDSGTLQTTDLPLAIGLSNGGFRFAWSDYPGASGYSVCDPLGRVWQDEELVGNEIEFSGLTPGSSYFASLDAEGTNVRFWFYFTATP